MSRRAFARHDLPRVIALALAVTAAVPAAAQIPGDVRARAIQTGIVGPLSSIPVPNVQGLDLAVRDREVLLVLGKALFWDEQLGSDGNACASCHFHAGVDNRSKNQLNPGLKNESAVFPAGDETFGNSPSAGVPVPSHFGPNYQLTAEDFPLRKLANVNNRLSTVLSDTNDVVSSQGVLSAQLESAALPYDIGSPIPFIFHDGGVLVRNVEPRNTPSTINAVFNSRNFWDGRAHGTFNGVNPFGPLDAAATVVMFDAGATPPATFAAFALDTASLASQAVGPPLSDFEMAYRGLTYPKLARKLLDDGTVVLARQRVAPDDSVLGPYSLRGDGATTGTTLRYRALVEQAFRPSFWEAPGWRVQIVDGSASLVESEALDESTFTVMEYNFPLFFGLAIAEYERTLVSDDTPFDRFMAGDDGALTPAELAGLDLFIDPVQGKCANCHGGPELTTAAVRLAGNPISRMLMGDGAVGVYDEGFYNIGVRPSAEDFSLGSEVVGEDLSIARRMNACISARVADGQTVEQANITCGVPRILAVPGDAAVVLRQAANLVGGPPEAFPLLDEADAMLAGVEPIDLVAASEPLFQVRELLLPYAPQFVGLEVMLNDARVLLPDPATSILPDPPPPIPVPPPPGTRFAPYAPLLSLIAPNERTVANGAFKTPSLRNVELTAPYFHNGGQATLEQVVDFYNRGGDFGHLNPQDLDIDIIPLGLTAQQKASLVAFMKALTDERVRWDRAPFDHPSLDIPNGGTPGVLNQAFFPGVGVLDDRVELPETGAGGAAVPLGTPNTPFANFLQPLTPPVPAAGVTLTANVPSPQVVGTPVVFTAQALGTSSPAEYRFWLFVDGEWQVVQEYGVGSTWTFGGAAAGTHWLAVWARTSAGVVADAYGAAIPFTFEPPMPTAATDLALAASPSSPSASGTPIVFTATGSGSTTGGTATPAGAYQYRFFLDSGSGWVTVQDYGIGATYTMSAPEAGTYRIAAWVRTTQLVTADVYGNAITHVVGTAMPTPATGLTLTPAPSSPSASGMPVVFTAVGSGSTTNGDATPAGAYEYRFFADDGSGWVMVQDYGVGSTYTMSAPAAGTYRVAAWVRTTNSVIADVYGSAVTHVVGLDTPTPATGVTLTASPASPSAAGADVVFTAEGSGSTAGGSPAPVDAYQYRFWIDDGSGWRVAQEYGVGSTYTLAASVAGSYRVAAWVRTSGGVVADVYGEAVGHEVQ